MNILIHQTAFLGDIVLSTPVISALHRLYPEAKLSMVTTELGAAVLKNDPRIATIVIDDKKGKHKTFRGFFQLVRQIRSLNCDRVYSVHKSFRTALLLALARVPCRIGYKQAKGACFYHEKRDRNPALHDVERNLQLIEGSDPLLDAITLYPPDTSRNKYPDFDESLLQDSYIVVAPGSIWKTKRWNEEGFQSLVNALQRSCKVVIVGSREEWSLAEMIRNDQSNALNLCGKVPLEMMISIVKNAKAMVCNDSVFMHIASAFMRPTVALYCATSPEFGFGPWRSPARILYSETLSCRPCRRHGSQHCPTGTERCRRDVKYYQVIDALKELGCL